MSDPSTSKFVENAIRTMLILAGLINFLPILGLYSAERIETMYSVTLGSADLEILMRHRAVLFGLLGGFIFYSVINRSLRLLACVVGLLSMLAFIVLAYSVGGFGQQLEIVILVDAIGLIALIVATALEVKSRLAAV